MSDDDEQTDREPVPRAWRAAHEERRAVPSIGKWSVMARQPQPEPKPKLKVEVKVTRPRKRRT